MPSPAPGQEQPHTPVYVEGHPPGEQLGRKCPGVPGRTRVSEVPLQQMLLVSWAALHNIQAADNRGEPVSA